MGRATKTIAIGVPIGWSPEQAWECRRRSRAVQQRTWSKALIEYEPGVEYQGGVGRMVRVKSWQALET